MAVRRAIRPFAALAAAMTAMVVTAPLTPAQRTDEHARVVVLGDATAALAHDVAHLGGTVERELNSLGGVVAELPATSIDQLRHTAGVRTVTEDQAIHLSDAGWDPSTDAGSLPSTAQAVNAATPAASAATGKGIDVALVDSGIAPVPGLTVPGKVVNGPDISFDSQNKAKGLYGDNYGHGTHIAGIIAGTDGARNGQYDGLAPDARLLNVKVADAGGAVDVSQVIAAIDWVVQHRTDNGMNVRVLNLSFGTDAGQSYLADPLAYAAEVAWRNGIVVVTAAGNDGTTLGHLTDPASDPFVISVGSVDTHGTSTTADDAVSEFSNWGDGTRNPDVVAPGRSIVSMRAPGSSVDTTYPTARVNKTLFRGSGTSQATAVVSGVVADLLQAHPDLTPDQVKAILTSTAQPIPGADARAQGAGLVNLDAALAASIPQITAQAWTVSAGAGSLDAARGSLRIVQNNVTLTGEQDVMGHAFDSTSMAAAEATASSWSGGTWNGSSWSGSSWSGSSWSGSSWSGSSWSGSSWSGSSWSGSSWSGSSWSTAGWGATATVCLKPNGKPINKCSAEVQSNTQWG